MMLEEKDVMLCYQCATCTGSCPVARFDSRYNPRLMILRIAHGEEERVIDSDALWWCTTCFTCQERCPQNIKVTEVILAMQNKAFELGKAPAKFTKGIEAIYKDGITSPLSGFTLKQRERLGLSKIEVNVSAAQKIIQECIGGFKK